MAHGHLQARPARPPLAGKALLEADRFLASGLLPECCIIGSQSTLAAPLPALGPITYFKDLPLFGSPIARISSARVWLNLILVYLNRTANKVAI